jgi:mannose-6-phosphate isomerase-like protein (cupin superfamily)
VADSEVAASSQAESYEREPILYSHLQVVDLASEADSVSEGYSNVVLNGVNQHCLRLAVFEGDYPWHHHPTSDELFVVVEGCLLVDLADGRTLRLEPWQAVTVPAGTVHRTRTEGRTVNLCFEELAAATVFVEAPPRT